MSRAAAFPLVAGLVLATLAGRPAAAETDVRLTVKPTEATVGQRLDVELVVELDSGVTVETPSIGPRLGPFTVFGGRWEGPADDGARRRYRWLAQISAYRTGALEIPPIRLSVATGGQPVEIASEALTVDVRSVLEPPEGEQPLDIADIKPPVSIPPDYRPLWLALTLVGVLAAAALALWWVQRRYAGKLAAVPIDDDLFRRVPPHEWIYRELQRLLEEKLAERGEVDRFYAELSHALKRYLEGRYRVDLLERTTEEARSQLEQAGLDQPVIERVVEFLAECDRVKFARERPASDRWKVAIEQVYEIVDRTTPAESTVEPGRQQGAA
ncbi:MAG TPA: hypothetical protein VD788_10195 [Candidatus Polarisedimenticolaceae bacterium]|nr:hypothetical protein [Candidatus Polarisedimenticolaceae bacterium]